ncbi:MAG: hypothetical protein ACJA02_001116, partial [Myxococcota bacterium]
KIYEKNLLYIKVRAVFLLDFILKNIKHKYAIEDGAWYKIWGRS